MKTIDNKNMNIAAKALPDTSFMREKGGLPSLKRHLPAFEKFSPLAKRPSCPERAVASLFDNKRPFGRICYMEHFLYKEGMAKH